MGEEYLPFEGARPMSRYNLSFAETYQHPRYPLINTVSLSTPELQETPREIASKITKKSAGTTATENFGKMKNLAKHLDYIYAPEVLHPKSPSDLVKKINPPNLKPSLPSTEKISNWDKFKQGANKVMNSKAANYAMQGINIALGFMGDNDKDINSRDAAAKQIRGMGENFLISSDNPFLKVIGIGSKGLDKLGAYGDATKGLGTVNDVINTLGSFIPGVGWFAGKSKEIQKDEQVQASTGYTGVTNDVNKAAQNAGGRFLAEMEKQNARRDRAQLAQEQAHGVLEDNKLALRNSGDPLYQLKTQVLTSGGYNAMSGKNGAKLYNLQEAKRILSNRLQSFKQGGAVNVIPDGALHKNRHHLEDIDEKFEDVTTKGIPVITEAKNGDIIQQAEVEKEEIIFNLEVTKKLEELMEKDTDEAAIEAGKLLTEEILRNTIDNTKKLL